MKNIIKEFTTAGLLVVFGGLAIIEVAIEVIFQLVGLFRRGYKKLMKLAINKVKPLYQNYPKKQKFLDEVEDIKIYEFNYEEEE